MHTKIIAHRGASADAPENTMPAFELAVEQGAQMLEFDVRSTRDGAVVVFHDDTTERWNGVPQPVNQLTLNEIQQIDLGGAHAPTLNELCRWAVTTELALNVEIKVAGIEAQVAQILRQHGLAERVVVSSFSSEVVRRMREVAPDIARGVLMGSQTIAPQVRMREAWPIPTLRQHAAHAWHPAWQLPMLHRLVPHVQRAGFAVYVWTVDDPITMRQLLALGVDGIITNKPALLREIISTWQTNLAASP
jgi:glycerophosphoryl diester phosphodiesterase